LDRSPRRRLLLEDVAEHIAGQFEGILTAEPLEVGYHNLARDRELTRLICRARFIPPALDQNLEHREKRRRQGSADTLRGFGVE
jgi:hypothetical protein